MSFHLTHRGVAQDYIRWCRQSLPAIPAGLIVPLNSTSVPSGWTRRESPAGKGYMVPRVVNDLGNASLDVEYTEQSLQASITEDGSHSGTWYNFEDNPGGAGSGYPDGAHDHGGTLTSSGTCHPDRRHMAFIEASSDQENLPAQAHFMRYDQEDLTGRGWTRTGTGAASHGMLYASSIANGGVVGNYGASMSRSFTIPDDGNHTHWGNRGGSNGGSQSCVRDLASPGHHDHGGSKSMTISVAIRQHLFHMWYHTAAKAVRDEQGMLGFWRTTTLPTGWRLRDDLVASSYISIAKNLADGGTLLNSGAASNPTLTASNVTTASDGAHAHYDYWVDQDRSGGVHADTHGAHTHTLSLTTPTWLPQRIFWAIIERIW